MFMIVGPSSKSSGFEDSKRDPEKVTCTVEVRMVLGGLEAADGREALLAAVAAPAKDADLSKVSLLLRINHDIPYIVSLWPPYFLINIIHNPNQYECKYVRYHISPCVIYNIIPHNGFSFQ